MKKITLFFSFIMLSTIFTFAQWQKMDLTQTGGGSISNAVNQLALDNNKLYAATSDGIFESASAAGADWTAYGLQGKRVFLMSFGVLKLALTIETAADDATKKTLQLYKHNGTDWVNTNFNPSKLNVFGNIADNLINFAQIQNGNQTVIIVPTWGNGIWRSANGGDTWTQVAYENHPTNGYQFFRKIPGVYTFAGDNVIYGTDKADYNMQYLIKSTDFGLTWTHQEVGGFFNPWAFHKRKMAGVDCFYWAGQGGNQGIVWRSADSGLTWTQSLTSGVPYWHNRRIIGDDDGPLYVMSSANDVYVSTSEKWNLDDPEMPFYEFTFGQVATGITIPSKIPAPANEPFFLTNLIKSNSKLYVSTYNDGIYQFALGTTALKNTTTNKLEVYPNPAQNELVVNTEAGANIAIYSVTGKLVKNIVADNANAKINIKDLQSSVYVVKVLSVEGQLSVNRFVKK